MDAVILNWAGGTLAPSKVELTDAEILRQYGGLMQTAISAFQEDPSYIVQIAEASAALKAKRQARSAKISA